ncbi:STAS domain-containing protein [Dactylosporangium matsuzakiense]|uniref:Anti-sigma factor antagonist n=1 Tax=Dactylosporangium matsuzakiense TaxID=53360 RepID=A0A9W6KIN4_9ACTN|nr:STAS domain-containing protein [Dactylosporangium matsuzakiense]GLL02792.1 anti-sigma factor antagonist [Dactylosporangium matsuzakiense]
MRITVRQEAGHTVIAVAGEIDIATAPRLQDAAYQALLDGASSLVIDLAETGFVDSSGLRVMVNVLKRVAAAPAGSLHIVRPAPSVMKVFELTRLDATFSMIDSVSAFPPIQAEDRERRP